MSYTTASYAAPLEAMHRSIINAVEALVMDDATRDLSVLRVLGERFEEARKLGWRHDKIVDALISSLQTDPVLKENAIMQQLAKDLAPHKKLKSDGIFAKKGQWTLGHGFAAALTAGGIAAAIAMYHESPEALKARHDAAATMQALKPEVDKGYAIAHTLRKDQGGKGTAADALRNALAATVDGKPLVTAEATPALEELAKKMDTYESQMFTASREDERFWMSMGLVVAAISAVVMASSIHQKHTYNTELQRHHIDGSIVGTMARALDRGTAIAARESVQSHQL